MGTVYDFFSGKSLDEINNALREAEKTNPEHLANLVEQHGKYLGCIPSYDAKTIRDHMDRMNFLIKQGISVAEEVNRAYFVYLEMLTYALTFLNYDLEKFDPNTMNVYVDSDGHVWIMDASKSDKGE